MIDYGCLFQNCNDADRGGVNLNYAEEKDMKRIVILAIALGGAAGGADIAWKWDDSRHVAAVPVVAEASLSGVGTGTLAQEGGIVRADGRFSSRPCDLDDSVLFRLDTFKRTGLAIMIR